MGCVHCSGRPSPVPVNPTIQLRPRWQLIEQPPEEKLKERDRLIVRIGQKRIDFRERSIALTNHALEVLRNVAEVLLEYPEIDLTVVPHAGPSDPSSKKQHEKELALSGERAAACREKLLELGVLSDIHVASVDPLKASDYSCIKVRAGEAKLLEPQQRLDMILSKMGFDFLPKGDDLSDTGMRTAGLVVRVLRETSQRVSITVPKKSSPLAKRRAEAIAQVLMQHGIPNEVSVKAAKGNQQYAAVKIEDDDLDVVDPQRQLAEILKQTPLAFRMNSAELAPEVLPAIKRCAAVLKGIRDMSCLIEAYSGQRAVGTSEVRIRETMLQRAERVVAWLEAEGVNMPLLAKGYASSFSDGGNGTRGARVVLTLIGPGEEELEPYDADDDEAGCMGNRGNSLSCL